MQSKIIAAAIAVTALAMSAVASPVSYTGSAKVVLVDTSHGLLPHFLGAAPSNGDEVTFSFTIDLATLAPGGLVAPVTKLLPHGISSINFKLNGVQLENTDTTPDGLASVLETQTTDPVLANILGLRNGVAFTAGSAKDADNQSWAVSFAFADLKGATPQSLDAPTEVPDTQLYEITAFGFRSFAADGSTFDTFAASPLTLRRVIPNSSVPAPEALGALVLAALLKFRRRTRS